MDAIIMPSTPLLILALKTAYPQFHFEPGTEYAWSPALKTVFYVDSDAPNDAQLLHELSHGILDHSDYKRDVELLAMERSAWDTALSLTDQYAVIISDDTIQSALDSYRDWLHARSTCPNCQATGLQTKRKSYNCLACHHTWNVNEARICGLRRTNTKPI
jgi:hypothetical protein